MQVKNNIITVLIKADDNNVYEVLLDNYQREIILNVISNLHKQKIQVINKPLTHIDLKLKKDE